MDHTLLNSSTFSVTTSWGTALIRSDGHIITGVEPPLPDMLRGDSSTSHSALDAAAPAVVRQLAARLVAYFNDAEPAPLASQSELEEWLDELHITGFRRRAALELARIPAGVTITYGELAELAGNPGAARAAGSMCSRNPLPVVIPCHRVLHAGSRGVDVGTYGAGTGTDYKRRLLEHEGWKPAASRA